MTIHSSHIAYVRTVGMELWRTHDRVFLGWNKSFIKHLNGLWFLEFIVELNLLWKYWFTKLYRLSLSTKF